VIAHIGGVPGEELIPTTVGAGAALLVARTWVSLQVPEQSKSSCAISTRCARQPQGRDPGRFRRSAGSRPATFGLPTKDDGTRNDTLLGQNIISGTHYELDFDSLRAAQTRIVLAAGSESEGEMANRGTHAVADRQGTTPVTFPSDHGGFLGGEYGQTGDPDSFAAKLSRHPHRKLIRSR
jgi:hypothetical protein